MRVGPAGGHPSSFNPNEPGIWWHGTTAWSVLGAVANRMIVNGLIEEDVENLRQTMLGEACRVSRKRLSILSRVILDAHDIITL